MNNLCRNNRKNATPQWQLNKMKTIIDDRWKEVCEAVNLRVKNKEE